jgi:PIN domain nuclease of toxin-antitoxin system
VAAVLDASALLAYLLDEPGADVVEGIIADGAAVSAINLAECFTRLVDVRPDLGELFASQAANVRPEVVPYWLPDLGAGAPLLPNSIAPQPFTTVDGVLCAALRPLTKSRGLSLGDRACLALGRRVSAPVFTADRSWLELDPDIIRVEVRSIRP